MANRKEFSMHLSSLFLRRDLYRCRVGGGWSHAALVTEAISMILDINGMLMDTHGIMCMTIIVDPHDIVEDFLEGERNTDNGTIRRHEENTARKEG